MHEAPDTLDTDAIDRLVETFYARVRQHPTLAPVFEQTVSDWPAHLARLKDFWCSVALRRGHYRGNPMQQHRALDLDRHHFDTWLHLWNATADEVLAADAALFMADLAARIGHGLKLGLNLHPRARDLACRPPVPGFPGPREP